MKSFRTVILAAVACIVAATAAHAHAFLDHAVPAVGSTVAGSPGELELTFTQNIVPAFSGAEIASAEGGAVPAGKPTVDSGNPNVLRVWLGHALKPGVYIVSWHVVSVDTHRTSGSYKFTVAP
jgi:methionine-rich copper-binding protein CopC